MLHNNLTLPRKRNFFLFLAAIPLIPLLAYAIAGAVTYVTPMNAESTGTHFLFICFIIALALAVPYLILKAGFHAAHLKNPQEKEIKLEDISKEEKPPLRVQ